MDYSLFRGVAKNVEPHLLEDGQFSDMRNMRSPSFDLEKRPGFEITDTLDLGLAQGFWPILIVDFDVDFTPLDTQTSSKLPDKPPFVWWNPVFPPNGPFPFPGPHIPIIPDDADPICLNCSLNQGMGNPVLTITEGESFFLRLDAINLTTGQPETGYDGDDASLDNEVYDLDTDAVTLNAFTLDAGGAIDITQAVDWTNGVWEKEIVLLAANNPDDHENAYIGAETDDKAGDACRLPVEEAAAPTVCPVDCSACATTLTATVVCPGASNKVITFTKSGCAWTPAAVLGLTISNITCIDAVTNNACGHNPSIIRWTFCVTVVPSGPPPFCAANGTQVNFYIALAACPPTGVWISDTVGWTATLS